MIAVFLIFAGIGICISSRVNQQIGVIASDQPFKHQIVIGRISGSKRRFAIIDFNGSFLDSYSQSLWGNRATALQTIRSHIVIACMVIVTCICILKREIAKANSLCSRSSVSITLYMCTSILTGNRCGIQQDVFITGYNACAFICCSQSKSSIAGIAIRHSGRTIINLIDVVNIQRLYINPALFDITERFRSRRCNLVIATVIIQPQCIGNRFAIGSFTIRCYAGILIIVISGNHNIVQQIILGKYRLVRFIQYKITSICLGCTIINLTIVRRLEHLSIELPRRNHTVYLFGCTVQILILQCIQHRSIQYVVSFALAIIHFFIYGINMIIQYMGPAHILMIIISRSRVINGQRIAICIHNRQRQDIVDAQLLSRRTAAIIINLT